MFKVFVFDTNFLVSASILPNLMVRYAFDKAARSGSIASSKQVLKEYKQVLFREKFDRYFISTEERL